MTQQNNFFLASIDESRAFDFRICFGKTLVAFVFDEKLMESNYVYYVSKDFLPLHVAVGQVLSISGYELQS